MAENLENKANPANDLLFEELCQVLEKLYRKKSEHYTNLSSFFDELQIKAAQIPGPKDTSLYPIMRLLLPSKERDRGAYNLKEKKLGMLLVKVLSLSKSSNDALNLTNFRSAKNTQESDFAGVAYFVLKKRVSQQSGIMTIGAVNEMLDKIASAEVGNKETSLDYCFSHIMRCMTAQQIKWFLRIVLKNMKLSMGLDKILDAFHPDAVEVYKSCSDLKTVCEELGEESTSFVESGVRLFFAISPMLLEKLDIIHTAQHMNRDKSYVVETKYDGERFQIHMSDGLFEYFSRNGHKYGNHYGKSFESGLLTPLMMDCFSPSVTSFIIDGEMMGWHKLKQKFEKKGLGFDIKKITDRSIIQPCFLAFDVLFYNGQSLIGPLDKGGMKFIDRVKILDSIFTDVTGVLIQSKRKEVKDCNDVLEAFNIARDNDEEGIVLKQTDSYYIINKRNAGWYKIKPDYTKSTMSDLDLVIIGADESENKAIGARSFHVACADKLTSNSSPYRWVSVGAVGNGLSRDQWEELFSTLSKHWTLSKKTSPPNSLVFGKKKPDFWIMPEKSIVLQIRATELIPSIDGGTTHTFRFPRIVMIRTDKPSADVLTMDEFKDLVNGSKVVNLSKRHVDESELLTVGQQTIRKKRKTQIAEVPNQFRIQLPQDVAVVSQALAGRKICVLSDDEDCSKEELVKIILSHGGRHVMSMNADTWCGVIGRQVYKIRKVYLEPREFDLVSTAWLRNLPPSQSPCEILPLDMLTISPKTRIKLSRNYDKYGDSYTENLDEDSLRKCFDKMDTEEPNIYLTTDEMMTLDEEIFDGLSLFSYLRPCFIHCANGDSIIGLKAKGLGATLCGVDSPYLTHLIVQDKISAKSFSKTSVKVVTENWLEACFIEGKLVSEESYLVQLLTQT